MKFLIYLYILIIQTLVFVSCANVASLSGGPKDEIPPKLDSIKSTPNFQLRFKPSKVQLIFDEWITLKNKEQILLSPPTSKNPEINYKGKQVSIEFDKDDTLRENTTYNLNFGNSIIDFTEGNALKNFSFIFSTGDKIDSLELSGRVTNAIDEKPEKDVLVMLYDTYEDSVVIKSKPMYFGYTNESGKFKITNIREGKFKVFALKDANSNYLYDNITEKIGFKDSVIHISNDTIKKDIALNLFLADLPLQIKDKSISYYGKINLTYSRKPDNIKILNSSAKIIAYESVKDSILIWFNPPEAPDSIQLTIKSENQTDTLNIKSRKKHDKPIGLKHKSEKGVVNIHPEKYLYLEFNQPVILSDTSNIKCTDTNKVDQVFYLEKDSINKRSFKIKANWSEEKNYIFSALPGAFKSLHGLSNDSITINFRTLKRSNYGNLICIFDSLDSKNQYIIQLKQKDKLD